MKKLIVYGASALIALGIVCFQYLQVLGHDDYLIVEHSKGGYKVFTYGFPLQVNDCNDVLDGLVHPSPLQTPYRITGNFLFFFLLGVVGIQLFKRIRHSRQRARAALEPHP